MQNVRELFGEIDIYLFDQILKDRFNNRMKILDAGCGSGRNLVYFLQNNYQVFGVDQNPEAVNYVRDLAFKLQPQLPPQNFQIANIESMPFDAQQFDAVISNAVLHFSENELHFKQMLDEMWRVLKPGGILFARLASTIGIENKLHWLHDRRYDLPDGSERFLVDEEILLKLTDELNAVLIEPLKTTNVQNLRCMTTWVIRKNL